MNLGLKCGVAFLGLMGGLVQAQSFETGMDLLLAKPSAFSGDSSKKYGVGYGFGFSLGYRPLDWFVLGANMQVLYVKATAGNDSTFDGNGSLEFFTRVYPLGIEEPRVYGVLGFAPLAAYRVLPEFNLFPPSGVGTSFRGRHFRFGAGYEHPLYERLFVLGELSFQRLTLTQRTYAASSSVDLNPKRSRWATLLKVGFLAQF